jgi:hypothetical protein
MSRRGYLGKISAILTADSKGLSRGLSNGAKDVTQFARKIQSTISGATSRAGKEFDNILTPLQKLQRALKLGVGQNLKLVNQQEVQAIRQFVEAAERIAKPVSQAAKDFAGLSAQVQRNFAPALESAQKAAEQLRVSLGSGARVSERDFANLEARINRVAQAATRLREAGQTAGSLASGQELRFQQPGFVQQAARAAALQQQAASLSPDQIQGGGVAALVGQQRQAAQEAQSLLSTLERIRITRNGDAQAAEAAYNRQVAGLREINDQLEQEITLSRQAAAAAQQLADAQNRFDDAERDRRSGVTARRNANAFEDATAGVMERQRPTVSGFGPVVRTMESELARARALQEQFRALPAEAQRQLEEQKRRFDVVANGAEGGAVSLGVLAAASDRLEESLRGVNEQLDAQAAARQRAIDASGLLNIDQRETRLLDNEGRTSNAGSPARRFTDAIGGEIGSVRRQLEELPGLAATLGPPVDNLTTRFQNLAREGIGTTAEQLQGVRNEVQAIQAAITSRGDIGQQFLGRFGGAGAAGLDLGIDTRSLNAIGAQIEFTQGRLASLAAQQRGPSVAALEAFRVAAFRAYSGLEENAERAAAEVARTREELIRTVTAADPSLGSFGRDFARVGDVARGAFGNAGLAIQQAAFAVEDFFSVTGGLDQRIRAAGNNLSQLGFILGGTTGLIVGISSAITAQLVAALIKWYNAGVDTEDQLKSLNQTLERQKSLAESLASAYDAVAESIERAGGSRATQQLRDRDRALEEIRNKQDEQRRERIASVDRDVQRERGIQSARQRELERATDPGERVRLQREIRDSRERERRFADAAVARPGIAAEQAVAGVADSRLATARAEIEAVARAMQMTAGADGGMEAAAQAAEEYRREAVQRAEAEVETFRRQQSEAVRNAGGPREQAAAARRLNEAEQARLQGQINRNPGDPANNERRRQLDALQQQLISLEKDIFRDATNKVAIEATKAAIDAANQIGRAQETLANALNGGASQIERELSALNERLVKAEGQLKTAQEGGDVDAAEAAKKEIEAVRNLVAEQESLANTTKAVAEALDRLSNQLVDTVAQEARSASDQARRTANRAQADRNRPGVDLEFEQRRAARLEAEAQRAEADREEVRARNTASRQDFERAAAAGTLGPEIKDLIRQRDEAQRVLDSETASVKQKQEAEQQREAANRAIDRELDMRGDKPRERANEAVVRAQQARSLDESILRGRELLKTPLERAREEAGQRAFDLKNALDEQGANRAQRDAAFSREALAQAMQVAPMLMGFRDERMNALLQGPSRAALNAADTNTMEGQRELNRLLRGDDPNKDVNLVEMQKQTELLQGVIDAIKQQDQGATVEIRG